MAANDDLAREPVVEDALVAVTRLVTDIAALRGVLDVHPAWNAGQTTVGIMVTLAEFDWDLRRTIIEMIDDVHRAYVDALTIDFDIVDRDHRPFAELM